MSHPARGAWIEITGASTRAGLLRGRTPQGVRGLKFRAGSRTPTHYTSHPARGAWIEIPSQSVKSRNLSSHPARGAWIEISPTRYTSILQAGRTPQGVRGLKYDEAGEPAAVSVSHPARGAWIEMSSYPHFIWTPKVAPRKGCVD